MEKLSLYIYFFLIMFIFYGLMLSNRFHSWVKMKLVQLLVKQKK